MINFCIMPAEDRNGSKIFELQFDFLDCRDGVLIRLLTDSTAPHIEVSGTIVGMPKGLRPNKAGRAFGCLVAGVLEALLMAGTEVLIALVLGSWRFWWLLLVIAWALFAPVLVGASLDNRNSGEARWPRMIRLPAWFQKLRLS